MTFSVNPLTDARTPGNVGGGAVDLSTVSADFKKNACGKATVGASKTLTASRIATKQAAGGFTPDQVKAFTTAYLPEAQKIVDATYAKYITSAPKLQLKFLTQQQIRADNPGNKNAEFIFAYVDNTAPTTINVAYKSAIFKKFNMSAADTKASLLHEVLHTRSMAFTVNMDRTFGDPLADGKPASFSDGSLVVGITEGLTEVFTGAALRVSSTASGYQRETK